MTSATHQPRGYVLVMTLAMLVVSASAMVGVARMSIREASLARKAQDDLQQRWGVTSIRLAVLPLAESLLQTAEASRKQPVPALAARIELSGRAFDLLISDEQAKANINAMLDRTPNRGGVETRLRQAMVGKIGARLRLRPEPPAPRRAGAATQPTTRPVLVHQISGFGQIFDNVAPEDLLSARYAATSPASIVTCWGSGAINVRRASETAMKLALSPPMSSLDVSRVIEARGKPTAQPLSQTQPPAPRPGDPVGRMLSAAGVAPVAASRMTLGSTCHSLWIIAQTPGRQWYYLYVSDTSNPDEPRDFAMRW